MAAGDRRIGLDGTFYYGTFSSTANTEAVNVDDVSLNVEGNEITGIERGKTWEFTDITHLRGTLTFKVTDKVGDPFVAALVAATLAKGKIALYPTLAESGEGLDADYVVSFTRDEANTEHVVYNVTAKPTDETRDPVWG